MADTDVRTLKLTAVVLVAALAACGKERPAATVDSTSPQGSAVATNPGAPVARKTVLFLGTSLTAGLGLDPDSAYPNQIQRLIDSAGLGYRVVNAGVSGETSSGLLRRLDWLLLQPLDVVVIETGANDGLRGVPVNAVRMNLEEIIRRLRAAKPQVRIALIQMEAMPNMGESYTKSFHNLFPDITSRTGVWLFPFLLDGVAGNPDLNQGDGIHPNEDGERIVTRNVWQALKPLLR